MPRHYYADKIYNRHNHECCDPCRNRYICDPCNFGCPSFLPLQPLPPPPPPPPGDVAHLVLVASYEEAAEQVVFNVSNVSALGANAAAENTVVTIIPDPGAVFTIADISADAGTFEIDLSGNIIWTVGTLALDAGAEIRINQPIPTAGAQTWSGVATTSTPNTPVDNDNEDSVTFGLIGGGQLTLNAEWDPDGGDEGEAVFVVTNSGPILAEGVSVVITPSPDTGLTAGDIIPPTGTSVTVDDLTGEIIWTIGDMNLGDVMELRFPQRPVFDPDTQLWEGTATADNFTQSDGLNEDGFELSLDEDGAFSLTAAYDDTTNIVSFTAENTGEANGENVELVLTPSPALVLDAADLTLTGFPAGYTVTIDPVTGVITISFAESLPGDIYTVEFEQPAGNPDTTWDGIITAENFLQTDGANEDSILVPEIEAVNLGLEGALNVDEDGAIFTLTNNGNLGSTTTEVIFTPTPSLAGSGLADADFAFVPSVGTAVYNDVTGLITWTVGPLAAGASATLEFSEPPNLGAVTWNGVATSTPASIGTDNEASVEFEDIVSEVQLNLVGEFTAPNLVEFSVTNDGDLTAADVLVTITPAPALLGALPADFNFNASVGTPVYDPLTGVITWTIPAALANGDPAFTLEFTQPANEDETTWTGVATTTTTPANTTTNTAIVVAPEISSILTLSAVTTPDGAVFSLFGSDLEATGVDITITPSINETGIGAIVVPAGITPTIDPGTGVVTITGATIPAGDSIQVTITGATPGTTLTGTASADLPVTVNGSPYAVVVPTP